MLTAIEARKLQEESFTMRGRVLDAIRAAAKEDYSEVVVANLNLSPEDRKEFEKAGYFITGSLISWAKPETEEKAVAVMDSEPQTESESKQ